MNTIREALVALDDPSHGDRRWKYDSGPLAHALQDAGVDLDAPCPPARAWAHMWQGYAYCGIRGRYINPPPNEDLRRHIGEVVGRLCSPTDVGLVPGGRARGMTLNGAVLTGADLDGVDLTGANLGCARLQRACLRGAVLAGADLYKADLRGADLRGADLKGALLLSARRRPTDPPIPDWVVEYGSLSRGERLQREFEDRWAEIQRRTQRQAWPTQPEDPVPVLKRT